MAKMVSPQSVAVACAAVGLVGKESALFKNSGNEIQFNLLSYH